jgi:transposase
VLRTGCRWGDVPRKYGSPTTCWRRLRAWEVSGIWERIWRLLLGWLDEQGKLQWAHAFLDASFVPAKKGGASVGKTKRGKGTKVMLVADGEGLPIGLMLASANHHELRLAAAALQTVRVPRRRGRPKQRPKELVADKAYDSKHLRRWLRSLKIKPTISPYQRRQRKRPKSGRPLKVGPGRGERWKVERTFAWLGSFRRLLVRHERYSRIFRAFFLVASIIISLRRF